MTARPGLMRMSDDTAGHSPVRDQGTPVNTSECWEPEARPRALSLAPGISGSGGLQAASQWADHPNGTGDQGMNTAERLADSHFLGLGLRLVLQSRGGGKIVSL